MRIPAVAASFAVVSASLPAFAGTITSVGAVKPLTDVSQLQGVLGTGAFDEGPTSGAVPLNVYSAQGMTFHTGTFQSILPGVTTSGNAIQGQYSNQFNYFPSPSGGGVHNGQSVFWAGVATFSTTVTQIGLTASTNGTQYLTVWNASGQMIGQVTWDPNGPSGPTSGFVGIDTMGVPIGMFAFGNDDLWNGAAYDIGGATNISDTWIWASGKCQSNASCDDANPCTDDVCTIAGTCAHFNNVSPCNDGNACTTVDVCSGGACVGGSAVTCSAVDACHDAGTCDPATGTCSSPAKPDGTACTDNDACTQNDTCQSGSCVAGTPVTCTAQDGCHTAGTCNPMTGVCSNPAKPDGSACSDGNACSQTDTCEAGVCTGQNPVLCPPPDGCHDAGTCDPSTGMCSNPAKPDGSACNDGNACTQVDTCQAGTCTGASPVMCAPIDPCHVAGMCDPTTGACAMIPGPDGVPCDDGNPCTQADACMAGVCVGGAAITCAPVDGCHDAGTCDPTTGACTSPALPDGTGCDDGNPCTVGDQCVAGACTSGSPVDCAAPAACHEGAMCDPMTGGCVSPASPDGTACDDGDLCTQVDTCTAGACTGGVPVACAALDECHDVGGCVPSTGNCTNPQKADGTPCSTGTCMAGVCTSGAGGSSGSAGAGGSNVGGNGGSSTAGNGGSSTAGSGGSSTAGSGGSGTAGNGGSSNGGSSTAGAGGSTAGKGGTSSGGSAGTGGAAVGGSAGSGGSHAGSGGASAGHAGMAAGGSAGAATAGAGGASGKGGSAGKAGAAPAPGSGDGTATDAASDSSGGCGCHVTPKEAPGGGAALVGLALLALARRRKSDR